MNQNWIVFFALMMILSVLAVGGTLLGAACDGSSLEQTTETLGQCARGWVGAFSGWAATVAAVVTVLVIFHQIRSNERLALKQATEARHLFGTKIEPLLVEIDKQWNFIESLDKLEINDVGHLAGAWHFQHWAKRTSARQLNELERTLTHMHPGDRDKSERLLWHLRRVFDGFPETFPELDEEGNEYNEPIHGHRAIQIVRLNFQSLDREAVAFDKRFEKIFSNRPVMRSPYPLDVDETLNRLTLAGIAKRHSTKGN